VDRKEAAGATKSVSMQTTCQSNCAADDDNTRVTDSNEAQTART